MVSSAKRPANRARLIYFNYTRSLMYLTLGYRRTEIIELSTPRYAFDISVAAAKVRGARERRIILRNTCDG